MFQSTHPRRVWPARPCIKAAWPCFNPHTHEGCDSADTLLLCSCPCFNPHTHEGCDFCDDGYFNMRALFQSTHPRRVWHSHSVSTYFHMRFQSTHPRRVWLRYSILLIFLSCFNPHTHEGCDYKMFLIYTYHSKFQSTHPRRVWPKLLKDFH